ncbi:MAG: hypothetical protein FWG66_07640 [Spirochaetes bacterium]|nr:hypothetical protein [Spirochaetota bacterium]
MTKTKAIILAVLATGIIAAVAPRFIFLGSASGLIFSAGILITVLSAAGSVILLYAWLFSKACRHIRILMVFAAVFFAGSLAGVTAINYIAAIAGAALFLTSVVWELEVDILLSKIAGKLDRNAGLQKTESANKSSQAFSGARMFKFTAISMALFAGLVFAFVWGSQAASIELNASFRYFHANIETSEDGRYVIISPLDEAGFEGLDRWERELNLNAVVHNRRGQRRGTTMFTNRDISWHMEGLADEDDYWIWRNVWLDLTLHLTDEPRTLNFTVSSTGGRIYDTITVIVDPAALPAAMPQEASL